MQSRTTFGERVREGMPAQGLRTAEDLARAVNRYGANISPRTAAGWMSMEIAELIADPELLALSKALNFRTRYLIDGTGGPTIPSLRDDDLTRAAAILDRLSDLRRDEWFEMGEWLIRQK